MIRVMNSKYQVAYIDSKAIEQYMGTIEVLFPNAFIQETPQGKDNVRCWHIYASKEEKFPFAFIEFHENF